MRAEEHSFQQHNIICNHYSAAKFILQVTLREIKAVFNITNTVIRTKIYFVKETAAMKQTVQFPEAILSTHQATIQQSN